MAENALAFWIPGPLEIIFCAVFSLIFIGVPVLVIILVVRYLNQNHKDREELRHQVDELEDEIKDLKQQIKNNQTDDA